MKLRPALFSNRFKVIACGVLLLPASAFGVAQSSSADQPIVSNAELLQEMKALTAKVNTLEKRLARYENAAARNEDAKAKLSASPDQAEFPTAGSRVAASGETAISPNEHSLFGLG